MGDKKNQINGVVDRNINGLDQHHRHESALILHQDQAGYRSTRSLYPAWDTGRAEELFGGCRPYSMRTNILITNTPLL